MADYVKAGVFTTPTSTGTVTAVSAASLGFSAEAFLLIPLGAITPGTSTTSCRIGVSYVVGSTVRANAVYRSGTTTRRQTSMSGGDGILILDGSSAVVSGDTDIVSGGLDINYTAVDASNSYQVMWVAFGGDSMAAQTVGAGTAGFTTTGLDPEVAFGTSTDMGDDDASVICLLGTSFGTASHQWNASFADNFLNETATDYSRAHDTAFPGRLLFHTWDGTNLDATFGTDGATWSFDAQTAACDALALEGFERSFASANFAKDNSGTNDVGDEVDPGFQPGVIIWMTAHMAAVGDPDASETTGTLSIGISTPTEQFCCMVSIADSGNGGDATVLIEDSCIAIGDDAASPTALATYDYDTLELVWHDNDTRADLIGYLAFEEDPSAGEPDISTSTITAVTLGSPSLTEALTLNGLTAATLGSPTLAEALSTSTITAVALGSPTLTEAATLGGLTAVSVGSPTLAEALSLNGLTAVSMGDVRPELPATLNGLTAVTLGSPTLAEAATLGGLTAPTLGQPIPSENENDLTTETITSVVLGAPALAEALATSTISAVTLGSPSLAEAANVSTIEAVTLGSPTLAESVTLGGLTAVQLSRVTPFPLAETRRRGAKSRRRIMIAAPKYLGAALPGIDAEITLFDTTAAFPGKNYTQMAGYYWFVVDMFHDQTIASVTASWSPDRGTTWIEFSEDTTVTAPTPPATSRYEYDISAYPDFRVVLVNGGAAQTEFAIAMALTEDKSAAA